MPSQPAPLDAAERTELDPQNPYELIAAEHYVAFGTATASLSYSRSGADHVELRPPSSDLRIIQHVSIPQHLSGHR